MSGKCATNRVKSCAHATIFPAGPTRSLSPSLSVSLLIDWQALCSPVRPTECLLVRKCVNLQGNLICVCGLCEGTWILNGNFDSLREIPMNYELYLCILPISILFVTVCIPNLINLYIYHIYVCVCVLSVLLLWRFVCTNRSKTAQKLSESGAITEGGGSTWNIPPILQLAVHINQAYSCLVLRKLSTSLPRFELKILCHR